MWSRRLGLCYLSKASSSITWAKAIGDSSMKPKPIYKCESKDLLTMNRAKALIHSIRMKHSVRQYDTLLYYKLKVDSGLLKVKPKKENGVQQVKTESTKMNIWHCIETSLNPKYKPRVILKDSNKNELVIACTKHVKLWYAERLFNPNKESNGLRILKTILPRQYIEEPDELVNPT